MVTPPRWLFLAGVFALRFTHFGFANGAHDQPLQGLDQGETDAIGIHEEYDLTAHDANWKGLSIQLPQGCLEFSEQTEEKNEVEGHGEELDNTFFFSGKPGFEGYLISDRQAPVVSQPRLYILYHSWKSFLH